MVDGVAIPFRFIHPVRKSDRFRMPSSTASPAIPWHRFVLRFAAVYNVVWGAVAIIWPLALFRWAGVDPLPNYPELWQCIGMIVGVYGVGYWIAAADPVRHWPIVLVGFLGKVFGPIGFAQAVASGRFPSAMGATILTNDLIWWIPFVMILLHARSQNQVMPKEPVIEEPVEINGRLTQRRQRGSAIVWSSLQTASKDSKKNG